MRFLRAQWDRSAAVACTTLALLILIVGWFGVSGTALPAEQLPYIMSAGVGSLFLLGIGGVLWISADLRDEWRKLDAIERALLETRIEGGPEFDARVEAPADPERITVKKRTTVPTAGL